jgi:hypothetical protein
MKKNQSKPKKQRSRLPPKKPPGNAATVTMFPFGRKVRVSELGVFDRSYPQKKERQHAIDGIKGIPEDQRSHD